jgi:hypothetical protein
MPIPLGILAVAGAGGGAGVPAYELIETVVMPSNASSVTISSIPSTYKHLQVRTMAWNASSNGLMRMWMNGDTGTNYSAHRLQGNGSSVNAQDYLGNPFTYVGYYGGSTQAVATPSIIDILDYTNTSKNKTVRALSGIYNSNEVALFSGLWVNTSAITSLTFKDNANYQFNAGSRFSLYGIKG